MNTCSVALCTYIIQPYFYYTVILSGSSSNPNFRGFLIQGRVVADGTTAAGTFVVNENNQRTACRNVSVSYSA